MNYFLISTTIILNILFLQMSLGHGFVISNISTLPFLSSKSPLVANERKRLLNFSPASKLSIYSSVTGTKMVKTLTNYHKLKEYYSVLKLKNSSDNYCNHDDVTFSCEALGGVMKKISLVGRTIFENSDEDDRPTTPGDNLYFSSPSVPTFATFQGHQLKGALEQDGFSLTSSSTTRSMQNLPKRLGLEGLIDGAFIVENAISEQSCDEIIDTFEKAELMNEKKQKNGNNKKIQTDNVRGEYAKDDYDQHYDNADAMLQVFVTQKISDIIGSRILPFIDMNIVNQCSTSLLPTEKILNDNDTGVEYDVVGLNRRWRIYRQDFVDDHHQDSILHSSPHIDTGLLPSTLSNNRTILLLDSSNMVDEISNDVQINRKSTVDMTKTENDIDSEKKIVSYKNETISRMTVLIYLNDDFDGGETMFFRTGSDKDKTGHHEKGKINKQRMIAAIKPKTGSALIIPQVVGGKEAVDHAQKFGTLYKGSQVRRSAKYLIRTDILFTKAREGLTNEEKNDPLWKYDELVRNTFLQKSPALNSIFLHHIQSLYNPHMGVENAGPLLYSLIRFTKLRRVVEIGAGFTTLWILQALKDNDDEMLRIKQLREEGNCKLLNIEWTVENVVHQYNSKQSSLLCIDNCLHQRETATGAGAVAKTLGLANYLEFVTGDAYDMQFDTETIDLLWCDFGVGSRMREFASGAWEAIKPGGFLVCHSTLTNSRTRQWLDAVRSGAGEEYTGLPCGEFVEMSFLEPQKVYQNSVTILQRRRSKNSDFVEPIYSEYA